MRHRGETPHQNCQRETDSRSEFVDQFSNEQQACGISQLEGEDNVAVSDLRPAKLDLESRLQQPEYLAIDIIHAGREQKQSTDQPTAVASCRESWVNRVGNWM